MRVAREHDHGHCHGRPPLDLPRELRQVGQHKLVGLRGRHLARPRLEDLQRLCAGGDLADQVLDQDVRNGREQAVRRLRMLRSRKIPVGEARGGRGHVWGGARTRYSHVLQRWKVLEPPPSIMYAISVHGPPQKPISGTCGIAAGR